MRTAPCGHRRPTLPPDDPIGSRPRRLGRPPTRQDVPPSDFDEVPTHLPDPVEDLLGPVGEFTISLTDDVLASAQELYETPPTETRSERPHSVAYTPPAPAAPKPPAVANPGEIDQARLGKARPGSRPLPAPKRPDRAEAAAPLTTGVVGDIPVGRATGPSTSELMSEDPARPVRRGTIEQFTPASPASTGLPEVQMPVPDTGRSQPLRGRANPLRPPRALHYGEKPGEAAPATSEPVRRFTPAGRGELKSPASAPLAPPPVEAKAAPVEAKASPPSAKPAPARLGAEGGAAPAGSLEQLLTLADEPPEHEGTESRPGAISLVPAGSLQPSTVQPLSAELPVVDEPSGGITGSLEPIPDADATPLLSESTVPRAAPPPSRDDEATRPLPPELIAQIEREFAAKAEAKAEAKAAAELAPVVEAVAETPLAAPPPEPKKERARDEKKGKEAKKKDEVELGPEYREPILAWLASIFGLLLIGGMMFVFILVLVALIV